MNNLCHMVSKGTFDTHIMLLHNRHYKTLKYFTIHESILHENILHEYSLNDITGI